MNLKELTGQVAVVTGGARGIGRAISKTLAENGATVVVADLNLDGAREVASEIAQTGSRAIPVLVNIAEESSVQALYAQLVPLGQRIDILVNNAGICRVTPILELEVAEWDTMMAVNLRGTFLMSREAFRLMKAQCRGKIINIASAAAKVGGLAAGAHYSASKAGVICFTKSLALQAAPFRINVNAVCPGPTATEMTEAWGGETTRAFAEKIPWREFGQPQDVADAVAFLASNRARYITGEILDVNGGFVMD